MARGGPQRIPRPPGSRPGRPAPWAELSPEQRRITLDDVRKAVDRSPGRPNPAASSGARPSAVLVPLYEEDDGRTTVILTRRAWHLRSHKGEVSFPGGRADPGERLPDTARREAHEEVDLDPALVEIVGELDHFATVTSRSFIVPFVGLLDGRPDLRPNPEEVAAILHVPLDELTADGVYREERWVGRWGRPIHFFEIEGDTVWGATAAMLRLFLCTVLDLDPD